MANTVKCLVKGKVITLSHSAFELAKEYYGAVKHEEIVLQKPEELRMPIIQPPKLLKKAEPEPPIVEKVEPVIKPDVIVAPDPNDDLGMAKIKAAKPKRSRTKKVKK